MGWGAVQGHECTLRKLAIGDDAYLGSLIASEPANVVESRLDLKTHALVRIGALIFFFLIFLLFGWIYDRRHEREYADLEA